jgi:hypothetical protein
VTIIGWLFIAAGTLGILYHAGEFNIHSPLDWEVTLALVVRGLAIVGGAYLLRGKKWARWLVVAWLGYHVVLSVFHSAGEVGMHAVLLGVIAFFLFRPPVSTYLR